MDWKIDNGEHFEKHASEVLLPIYPWLLQDFRNATGKPLAGLLILEIGCGPGFMLKQFNSCSPGALIGVDQSFSMLQRAVKSGRSKDATLVQADACELPFTTETFDLVFSRGSIFFWKDIKKAFESIKCCVKPGGKALIGGGYGLSTPQELVDTILASYEGKPKSSIPKLDLDDLLALATSIGGKAEILQARKRGFWLFWQL